MSRVRYCENCGSPLQPGIRFCENCGTPVPVEDTQGTPRDTMQGNRQDVSQDTMRRNRQGAPHRSSRSSAQIPPQGQYRRMQAPPPYQQEDERRRRYRQEGLENDWQQSWDRQPSEEDEQRITPAQYVLIGLAVVLLIALIVFGIFWVMGRSSKKSDSERNGGQTSSVQTDRLESESSAIAILDGGGTKQPEASQPGESHVGTGQPGASQSETTQSETKQSETEPIQIQTQAQTQPQTQAQTQPQTQAQTSSAEGYIPESSQRALTESDVSGMSYDDLQMAINEIYARHGRKFNDPNIQAYFNSQSWYQGIISPEDFSNSVFSATESQNIQYLLNKMGVQ